MNLLITGYKKGEVEVTLEIHSTDVNPFVTVDEFWECACGENFVHFKSRVGFCEYCCMYEADSPDARYEEVLEYLTSLGYTDYIEPLKDCYQRLQTAYPNLKPTQPREDKYL